MLARSPNWPQDLQAIPKKDRQHANVTVDGVRYRAVRLENVPVLDREGDAPSTDVLTVTYAAPTDQMTRAVARAGIYIAAGSGLLLLITVAIAVLGLRRGLRPLAELAISAASVNTSNWKLNPSEAAVNTTELAPLTQAMTAMLDGLHRAFTQQREFLANAAHELKTPVAILKSTLQSLLQRPRAAEEYRAGLEQALDDMARLEQLMHSMLRLARAEQWAAGSARRDLEAVEVAATCESALERLAPVARERGVTIHFVSNGPMPMRADADDLELVWSNLLENAIRFSPAGGDVQLRARSDGSAGLCRGRRQRSGNSAVGAGPPLRTVSSRRQLARARHRRIRVGSCHLESADRGLWGDDHSRKRSWAGHAHGGRGAAGRVRCSLLALSL